MGSETLLYILVSGTVLGGLYALMAVGLSVVWTTIGVFNFAHGTFVALGAYIAWQVASVSGGGDTGFLFGAVAAVLILFLLGYLLHYCLIKPFERNPNIVLLSVITTLAAASIIESMIQLLWGPREKQISPPVSGNLEVAGLSFAAYDLLIFGITLALLFLLAFFLKKSATGRAMRAAAQNREAAQLMGFNVTHLYALTIGIAAATAAIAGLFIGSIRFINPSFGADPLMKSLIVVIFGGIAHFTSPIYAAFIVGIIEAFSVYYFGLYWAPSILFGLMIIVLIIKPEGLFGFQRKTL